MNIYSMCKWHRQCRDTTTKRKPFTGTCATLPSINDKSRKKEKKIESLKEKNERNWTNKNFEHLIFEYLATTTVSVCSMLLRNKKLHFFQKKRWKRNEWCDVESVFIEWTE